MLPQVHFGLGEDDKSYFDLFFRPSCDDERDITVHQGGQKVKNLQLCHLTGVDKHIKKWFEITIICFLSIVLEPFKRCPESAVT